VQSGVKLQRQLASDAGVRRPTPQRANAAPWLAAAGRRRKQLTQSSRRLLPTDRQSDQRRNSPHGVAGAESVARAPSLARHATSTSRRSLAPRVHTVIKPVRLGMLQKRRKKRPVGQGPDRTQREERPPETTRRKGTSPPSIGCGYDTTADHRASPEEHRGGRRAATAAARLKSRATAD